MRLEGIKRVRQGGQHETHGNSKWTALILVAVISFTSNKNRRSISTLPMDTELARIFSRRVARAPSFEAAHPLHVTQSTVSTRIQRPEETLSAELFVPNKARTTLTPAGRQ